MAINNISLRRLLRFVMAAPKKRVSLLREDIRSDKKKTSGQDGGGDFYGPFWAAAKAHVKGWSDIAVAVPKIISANIGRERLYRHMQKSFIEWWTKKRAWRNEPFNIFDDNFKSKLVISDIMTTIRADSILAGTIAQDKHRLVYPYFAEETRLTLDGARLGIFVLSQSLPQYPIDAFRVLDVVQGVSYSVNDCPLKGTEMKELQDSFQSLEAERVKLLEEYP